MSYLCPYCDFKCDTESTVKRHINLCDSIPVTPNAKQRLLPPTPVALNSPFQNHAASIREMQNEIKGLKNQISDLYEKSYNSLREENDELKNELRKVCIAMQSILNNPANHTSVVSPASTAPPALRNENVEEDDDPLNYCSEPKSIDFDLAQVRKSKHLEFHSRSLNTAQKSQILTVSCSATRKPIADNLTEIRQKEHQTFMKQHNLVPINDVISPDSQQVSSVETQFAPLPDVPTTSLPEMNAPVVNAPVSNAAPANTKSCMLKGIENSFFDSEPTIHWRPNTVLIVGDSMIGGLEEKKIHPHGKVKVRSFPGASVEALLYHITPLLWKRPKTIVLHIGTNNTTSQTSDVIFTKITRLVNYIKETISDTEIMLSTPTYRVDHGLALITCRNLANRTRQSNFTSVDNSNISAEHLALQGLHLNTGGSLQLARNIINVLKSSP